MTMQLSSTAILGAVGEALAEERAARLALEKELKKVKAELSKLRAEFEAELAKVRAERGAKRLKSVPPASA
jgi:hypothetical protein